MSLSVRWLLLYLGGRFLIFPSFFYYLPPGFFASRRGKISRNDTEPQYLDPAGLRWWGRGSSKKCLIAGYRTPFWGQKPLLLLRCDRSYRSTRPGRWGFLTYLLHNLLQWIPRLQLLEMQPQQPKSNQHQR